jgi:hypothetical protein
MNISKKEELTKIADKLYEFYKLIITDERNVDDVIKSSIVLLKSTESRESIRDLFKKAIESSNVTNKDQMLDFLNSESFSTFLELSGNKCDLSRLDKEYVADIINDYIGKERLERVDRFMDELL